MTRPRAAIALVAAICLFCARRETKTAPRDIERHPRIAIILCKFADNPTETRPPGFYRDYYTRLGTGGAADYWHDVTFGALDLTRSTVVGWFTMKHKMAEVRGLVFPGGRNTLVQWGRDTAEANGVPLSSFDGVLVVQNWGIDHGAAGNGIVIVDQNVALLESTFITHEMGHLFGLQHSYGENVSPCISGDGVYCDAWDIMSAMNVFLYSSSFEGVNGTFGPGLNNYNLKALGALSRERVVSIHEPDFSETVELAPLNQPLQPGGSYAIEIAPGASSPVRETLYTIEYRHKAGWDRAVPHDAVLIHEEKNGHSYLKPTANNSSLRKGQRYVTESPKVYIEVQSIDPGSQKAIVRVWDLPEDALRRDEADGNLYLIDIGNKRLVTSRPALLRLHRKFNPIRSVPAGALAGLRDGPPVN